MLSVLTPFGIGSVLLLVASCGGANTPIKTTNLAAQGLYVGALSSDTNFVVIGSLNHGASLWRNSDNERLFNWNHQSETYSDLVAAGFSPDGRRAVTTDPRTLVVWDTETGESLAFWATPAAVLDVAIASDGRSVFMGLKDHSGVLFDARTGNHVHTFLHEGPVSTVALSADGHWAFTGSDDETTVLWDLRTGDAVHRIKQTNPVNLVAISGSGRYLFSAAEHRLMGLWDGSTGELSHTLTTRNTGVTAARFSDDDAYLLLGYLDRRIELWSTETGSLVTQWQAKGKNPWNRTGAAILAVGFTNGRNFRAVTGDGQLVDLVWSGAS